ncbi:MAG TPA: DUF5116 domain-containing protein [Bacteroidales bacterium]|nr:DUF5116 domain-containing protein [Bacteroidales bacterium]
MKKIILLYIALIGIVSFSCTKKDAEPVLDLTAVIAPVVSQPAANASIVLTEEEAASKVTFTWSAADFKVNLAVTYRVMMANAGTDFAEEFEILKTTNLTGDISYADLNNKLNVNGGQPGVASDVEFRVVASVSDIVEVVNSTVVAVQITPYLAIINYPKLYVPGGYQGWDVTNENTVIYSLKSDGKYEGYLYFKDTPTEFKFADGPSWDVNYGDDLADGTLDRNGANIVAAAAGMYKLNVNINTLTYTKLLTAWGIIGSATAGGWDSDQKMVYDETNRVLTLTLDLVAGEIKFRANDAWDLNYGGAGGYLVVGGDNIAIAAAGNYTITINLSVANYTYTILKN